MSDRELIRKALWLHPPTTEKGKVVGELVDLCERLLAGRNKPAPDAEPALRREIDDGPAVSLLLWADLLEEKGEDALVCSKLRDLAREGKWPGRVGGLYRWSPERPEFGGGSSWTLPENVTFTIARNSVHLGGKEKGRFATPSAALLAAARVLAGKGEPVSVAPPATDEIEPFIEDDARWAGTHNPAIVGMSEGDRVPCLCGGVMLIFRSRWGGNSAVCQTKGCHHIIYSTAEDRL